MLKPAAMFLALLSAGGAARGQDLTSLAITVPSFANPYFNAVTAGAQDQARDINPQVKIIAQAPEYDLGKQANFFDAFISKKVDAIIIAATDANADGPLVAKAKKQGIVVVAADSAAPGVDAAIETDNVQLGVDTCAYMADQIKGRGDIIILNGPPVAPILARVKGCKQALAKTPDIHVLSDNQDGKGAREGGLNIMLALMTRYQHIDAVFAINDQEAIGASLAARQANRTDPVFFGVDGSPDAVAALKDPTTRLLATGAQDPYALAQRAVVVANDILHGKPPTERVEQLKPILVTRSNVDSYKGWGK